MTDPKAAAGTLACPGCGAPAAPDRATCPYCGIALALVSCPRCLARIFQGAEHCSHCGAEIPKAEAIGLSELHCPRCATALQMVRVGGASLGECMHCGGTWVDGRTFERLIAEKEERAVVLSAALPGFEEAKAAHPRMERYWPCPVCKKLMNRVNFANVSGVILDACRAHGVWFDADELRELVVFLQSGGLERARAKEDPEPPPLPKEAEAALLAFRIPEDESHEWMGPVVRGAVDLLHFLVRRV
jgi:Zn-finger nucleic acid-binding protein